MDSEERTTATAWVMAGGVAIAQACRVGAPSSITTALRRTRALRLGECDGRSLEELKSYWEPVLSASEFSAAQMRPSPMK
jgi:hypothetical protein